MRSPRTDPGGFSSEIDLGIVAEIGGIAGDGGDGHLGEGHGAIGAVPEFAILGRQGDDAYGGVVLIVPPGLVEVGPEFMDQGAVIADFCRAGHDGIFVPARVDPGGGDEGEFLDLAVLFALGIDEEMDGMAIAIDAGRQRPRALALTPPFGHRPHGLLRFRSATGAAQPLARHAAKVVNMQMSISLASSQMRS